MTHLSKHERVQCAECGRLNVSDNKTCKGCGQPLNGPVVFAPQQRTSVTELAVIRADLLRHGDPLEVVRHLSALNGELRLALQNALERIAVLEERMGQTGNE